MHKKGISLLTLTFQMERQKSRRQQISITDLLIGHNVVSVKNKLIWLQPIASKVKDKNIDDNTIALLVSQ